MLRKFRDFVFYLVFLCFSVLLLLEVCYRFYVVDFYGGNLVGLNTEADLSGANRTSILVIGDSFSADQRSYVSGIKAKMPNQSIVNTAIPGTCIRQHQLFAKKRLERFPPALLIYQVYVGNDLLEYRHSLGATAISLKRKAYWWLADRFLVLGYLNARMLGFTRIRTKEDDLARDPKSDDIYSSQAYNQRTKLLLKAEPALIQNSALLQVGREEDMKAFCSDIKRMLSDVSTTVNVVVLVIPHCAQTGELYLERMVELGASSANHAALMEEDYPFVSYLNKELSTTNCMVVNTLPWLKNESREELYFYPNDPHLNEFGHQRLADSLFHLLEQKSWIPQ